MFSGIILDNVQASPLGVCCLGGSYVVSGIRTGFIYMQCKLLTFYPIFPAPNPIMFNVFLYFYWAHVFETADGFLLKSMRTRRFKDKKDKTSQNTRSV